MEDRENTLTRNEILLGSYIAEKVEQKMDKRYVTKELALRSIVAFLAFLFLASLGLIWDNPNIINQIKEGEPKAPPVNAQLKDICESSILR